jgi:hypothetical protein
LAVTATKRSANIRIFGAADDRWLVTGLLFVAGVSPFRLCFQWELDHARIASEHDGVFFCCAAVLDL